MKDTINTTKSYNTAAMNVLGCLINNPLLFANNNYKFSVDDFLDRFPRICFGALMYLYKGRMQTISPIDVDQFLKQYPEQYEVFSSNQGTEYLEKCSKIAEEKNLAYHYSVLKKYSLLSHFIKQGIDVSEVYNPDIEDIDIRTAMQQKFDNMSVDDIIHIVENKFLKAKEIFSSNSDMVKNQAGDGIEDLLDRLKVAPEFGLPFTSEILTLVFRGLRKGCLYTESSAQGVGKSRRQAGESAHLAISEMYNKDTRKWEEVEFKKPVLLISTELELSEVQTMWLAYISGVQEEHILDSQYQPGEEERVRRAANIIKEANLYFVSISNYDIDDIENLIKEYANTYGVEYVFYDYLSTTLKIMAEGSRKTKMAGLREDQILLMFCTRLKDLARSANICIWTSTQLSGNWKEAKEADQQLLRGAKAISDKTDCSSILLPVREADKAVIESWIGKNEKAKGFVETPTHVIHVFKVRRSHFNNIRIYIHFDRDCCRITDCFVTNNEGVILPIAPINIETILENNKVDKIEEAIPEICD